LTDETIQRMRTEYQALVEKGQPILVTFSDEEYAALLEVAKARNAKEKRFGAMTYNGKRGSLEAHIIGILPEAAVAKYFDRTIDPTIYENSGDSGVDLTDIPGYGNVGVKATTYRPAWLRVEVEHFSDDVQTYVCCYYDPGKPKEVWIEGYATHDEVAAAPQGRCMNGGPLNYLVKKGLHRLEKK